MLNTVIGAGIFGLPSTVQAHVGTYSGFEAAVVPAGEARDPGRHLPFALLTGIAVVVVIFVLIQVVCIGTLPELAGSERPLSDASLYFLGGAGGIASALGLLLHVTCAPRREDRLKPRREASIATP